MASRKRKGSRWRPLKFALIQRLGLPVAWPVLRGILRSCNITVAAPETEARLLVANQGAVICMWHEDLLTMLAYGMSKPEETRRRVGVLVSPSRDGELIVRILEQVHMQHIRGSSSSRAIGGLKGIAAHAAQGDFAIFTPDGPRGPRRVPKIGAIAAARKANASLWAARFEVDRAWHTNSWDRAVVPKPRAKIIVFLEEIVAADAWPADMTDAQTEAAQASLSIAMQGVPSC